jgi:hypothetical protein
VSRGLDDAEFKEEFWGAMVALSHKEFLQLLEKYAAYVTEPPALL